MASTADSSVTDSTQDAAQRTSPPSGEARSEVTISVSGPQKELLNNNEVVEEFCKKLLDHDIQVDSKSLHTDKIVILRGNPMKAKECLNSVVCWDASNYPLTDESAILTKLASFRLKFSSKFADEISQDGRVVVAYLPSIQQEVMSFLDDLKYGKKLVLLPDYLLEFFKRHLRRFSTTFNSNLHSHVELSLHHLGASQQPHLQVKCERSMLAEAVGFLEKRVSMLCLRQTEVKRSLGNYLQTSPDGKRDVQTIENDQHVALKMEVEDERVLLEARAPGGRAVVVRVSEGSLAGSECPVLVLPLWEGQDDWPSAYECILLRDSLNSSASHYLSRVGPSPKVSTLVLRCPELSGGQTVIILYIPRRSHDRFQELVSTGLTEAFKYAKGERCGLALPMTLCGDVDVHHVLTAVCHCCDDDNLPPLVQFYVDSGVTCLGDISEIFRIKEWTIEKFKDSADAMFDERVRVVVGDIMSVETDAVVNSTDPRLEHKHGQVSKMFLQRVGKELTAQCREQYQRGIGEHIVAVTQAFGLTQFKHMFHVALPQVVWSDQRAKELLQALRTSVEACLCLASIKGLRSISFPAVAAGTLQYPAHLEARTLLDTTRDFFAHMPHSSLRKVIFVAYKRNQPVAKVFKAEETVYRYSLHRLADCVKADRRFEVRNVLVQVIMGNAKTHKCSAQLLICADPPAKGNLQDYKKQMGEEGNTVIVNSQNVKNDIRDCLKNTTANSVQLNMQTFDADQVDNMVSGIERANSQTVHIIVIVAASANAFQRLCDRLARSYSAPSKRNHRGPCFRPKAHVLVCGSTKDTSEAIKKVLALESTVPEKYTEADRYNLHPSFLEPSTSNTTPKQVADPPPQRPVSFSDTATSGSSTPTADPAQQSEVPCPVTIPRETLRKVSMDRMLNEFEKLNIAVSFSKRDVRFRTDLMNFQQLRDRVQTTIAALLERPPHTAPAWGLAAAAAPGTPDGPVGPGQSEDVSTSLGPKSLESLGSLGIPSVIITQQPVSKSEDFGKNISQLEKSNEGGRREDAADQTTDKPGDVRGDAAPPQAAAPLQAAARRPLHVPVTTAPADSRPDSSSDDESAIMAAAKTEALEFLGQRDSGTDSTGELEAQALLRQEEIPLTTKELAMLQRDSLPESKDAFIKVLPTLKKAVVLSFKYVAIRKAAHLVKVKTGKLAITTKSEMRGRQKYRSGYTSDEDQSPRQMETSFATQSYLQPGEERGALGGGRVQEKQFVTTRGVRVLVYTGDITMAPVDAIVNPAHALLTHHDGIAATIASEAGADLQRESSEYIARHGPLKVTEVAVTTAGSLPCQMAFHALGPRWAEYSDKALCQRHLTDTVTACLNKAEALGLTSIAFSSVGSGQFGVPRQVCAQSYLEAVLVFNDVHGHDSRLKDICILDLSDDVVAVIQDAFAAHWRTQ